MIIKVRVVPKAKVKKIIEEEGRLKIYLSAPAVEGKANIALIEALAEHFNVKRRQVRILRGEKNRDKVIEIQ